MNDLDRKIRDALRQEDSELFAEIGDEPSLFEMSMDLFRGRNRWLSLLAAVGMVAIIGLGIVAGVKFHRAETTRDMFQWAAVCALCMLGFGLMKVWAWLEINKNFVTREIKRVELQIARLAERMKN